MNRQMQNQVFSDDEKVPTEKKPSKQKQASIHHGKTLANANVEDDDDLLQVKSHGRHMDEEDIDSVRFAFHMKEACLFFAYFCFPLHLLFSCHPTHLSFIRTNHEPRSLQRKRSKRSERLRPCLALYSTTKEMQVPLCETRKECIR